MPYKDLRHKREWERRHRSERRARRRELRRIEGTLKATQVPSGHRDNGNDSPWRLLAGGGVLALYNPALALGVGSLTLIVAALRNKSWRWWVIGAAVVAFALMLLLNKDKGKE
jgi:hypothetical protein